MKQASHWPLATNAALSAKTKPSASCIAGILAGGASRRMGTCKAYVTFRDRTFVEIVAEAAAQVAGEVVLLGNAEIAAEGLRQFARLSDAPFGRGPLRGLHSLLRYCGPRWGLLLACDMPMLTVDLLGRLVRARDEKADAVAFLRLDREGEFHACCAAFHPRALPVVRTELARGAGRIQNVLRAVRCITLYPTEEEEGTLVNVNTPEDLASLESRTSGTGMHGLQEINRGAIRADS